MTCSVRLCLKSPKSRLETVSTVRGSGWVAVPKFEIAIDYEYDRFTHPLPRTVLTVSKRDVRPDFVGVGMVITDHPLHRSGRALLTHPALVSGHND
jgi:hypothetical protein